MTSSFSKKEMLDDLTSSIREEIERIKAHFGISVVKEILNGRDNQGELIFSHIKHLPITDTMSSLYDYGLMGEVDISEEPQFHVTNGLDWIHSQQNADLISIGVPDSLTETVYTAYARWALDKGDSLTIAGLARLARISERSVRNAASKKEFQTESQGSQTLVRNDDARRWLVDRRGFIPTKPSNKDIMDILVDGTRTNLGNYLKRIRENNNISIEKLAEAIGDDSTTYDIAHKIENGMERISIENVDSISKLLGISYPILMVAVINIYYPDDMLEILASLIRGNNERGER